MTVALFVCRCNSVLYVHGTVTLGSACFPAALGQSRAEGPRQWDFSLLCFVFTKLHLFLVAMTSISLFHKETWCHGIPIQSGHSP